MNPNPTKLFRLLGISFFSKALTHILGGLIGICGMNKTDIPLLLETAANGTSNIYSGILVQLVSCITIIILGVLAYRLTSHTNKTTARIALKLYTFESILLAVSQVIAFALLEISKLFIENGNVSFITYSTVLLDCMDFTMNLANIPFAIGTILFFYLFFQNKAIPRWLSVLALLTVTPLFIGTVIQIYDIKMPFAIMGLYAPFEFIAGTYIFVKHTAMAKSERRSQL